MRALMEHNHLRERRRRDRMEHTPACTIGQVPLLALYKAEKPSVRSFLVVWISAVDARIGVKLARNEAPVFWDYEVYF